MARSDGAPPKEAPEAKEKWLTASVANDTAAVIARISMRRKGETPIAAVIGSPWWTATAIIDRINSDAEARGIEITIGVGCCKYLSASAWSFFAEGDPAVEDRVADKAIQVLSDRASIVAAATRRKATALGMDDATRKARTCAPTICWPRRLISTTRPALTNVGQSPAE